MFGGCALRSSLLFAILLIPHRVECLKITWGTVLDFSLISCSCSAVVMLIQFI